MKHIARILVFKGLILLSCVMKLNEEEHARSSYRILKGL